MAQARLEVDTRSRGANLRTIARDLARMDDAQVKAIFKRRLEDAAGPFVPLVRASALAIPTTGTRHTGLRARIGACARDGVVGIGATWGECRGGDRAAPDARRAECRCH